jgi:hypothetical protein
MLCPDAPADTLDVRRLLVPDALARSQPDAEMTDARKIYHCASNMQQKNST